MWWAVRMCLFQIFWGMFCQKQKLAKSNESDEHVTNIRECRFMGVSCMIISLFIRTSAEEQKKTQQNTALSPVTGKTLFCVTTSKTTPMPHLANV